MVLIHDWAFLRRCCFLCLPPVFRVVGGLRKALKMKWFSGPVCFAN
jgi:hypothetical protein